MGAVGQGDSFVGEFGVKGRSLGGGVYSHSCDPQPSAGSEDAAGDFAAVGYEDFVEH